MSGLSSHQIAREIFAELLPYRRRFPDPILDRHSEEQEVAAIQIPRLQAFSDRRTDRTGGAVVGTGVRDRCHR